MTTLLLNLLLALAWMALTGQFVFSNFIMGFGLGYLMLWLVQSVQGPSSYFSKVRQVIGLTSFFIGELIKANLRVAYDVVSPRYHMRPGVVAIPLDIRGDAEITLLANLITLTPGTLSLDVSSDRSVLYVHSMYIDSVEGFRSQIKDGFERRVQEVFR